MTGDPMCRNCRFWEVNVQDFNVGSCRRFPPSVHPFPVQNPAGVVGVELRMIAPATRADEFCGEWSVKTVRAESS